MANLISFEQVRNHAKYRHALTLSTFDSVESVDTNVAAFLIENEVTKSEYSVLIHLARHSIKAYGVSWGRVPYIAELTELSERTVQRCLSSLETKGIINRVESFRADGGRDGNFIVIQRYETTVEDATIVTPNVIGVKAVEAGPDKGLDAVFSGEAIESLKSPKAIKSLEPKKEKDLKNDDVTACMPDGFDSDKFYNSNFHKYGMETMVAYAVKMDVPITIFSQLNKALVVKYKARFKQFDKVNPNDLISSIWKAVDTFNEQFRNGHNISSYGKFFEAIFTKELNRRIVVRAQANKEDVYSLVS